MEKSRSNQAGGKSQGQIQAEKKLRSGLTKGMELYSPSGK
jgi:hypothetical protein